MLGIWDHGSETGNFTSSDWWGESTAGVALEWRHPLIPFSITARVLQDFIKGLMSLKDDFILPSAASLPFLEGHIQKDTWGIYRKGLAYCPISEHTQYIDTVIFGSQFSVFIVHKYCVMLLAMSSLSFGSSGKEWRPHKERDFIMERSL